MRLKPFSQVKIDELKDVQLFQDKVGSVFQALNSVEISAGQLLKNVQLDIVARRIEHKLDREPLGYIVVSMDAQATIWQSADLLPTRFLNLTASAPVAVSLWVF